jgi:hypothetical protein
MSEDLPIPRIIRMNLELASRPKPLGERPTWESSLADARYGVWVSGEWTWWQRLANQMMEGSPWLLTPFWGWHRYQR